jgi:hypothetical protein
MKKLLVLAIVVIMVFAMAAVSMAAITVGGEVNFGFNMRTADANETPISDFGNAKIMADANKTTISDFGNAKITATAALNDEVTAFAAIKAGDDIETVKTVAFVDEAWVKLTEGFGTFKIGKWGWNGKEKLDILAPVADLNNNAGMNLVATVAEGVTVDVYAAEPQDKNSSGDPNSGGFLYGFKAKYDTDSFGGAIAMSKGGFESDTDSAIQLDAWYTMDAFCLFLDYNPEWKLAGKKLQSAIIGATYDSADVPVYARVEYDASPETGADSAYGFRLGYKINGAKIEYQTIKDWVKGSSATSYLKVNVVF